MASRNLGTLTIDLVARTGGFTQGLTAAERSTERWRKQTERESERAAAAMRKNILVITAAAAAAGTALLAMAKTGVETINAQAALADSLDTTYDSITALTLAAGDSNLDGLEGSLTRLNRRLGAAEVGAGAAANAVRDLNLDLEALSGMDVDERVATIADAFRDSGVSMQRAARFAQDLGFEQQQAAQFFTQGGDAIRAYREEVDRLGLSVSDIDAARIQDAVNAMGALRDVSRAAAQQLAIAAIPALEAAGAALEKLVDIGAPEKIVAALEATAKAAAAVAAVVGGRLAGAALSSAAAFAAGTIEAARYQAALARMAGVSSAAAAGMAGLSAATRAANIAMSLVGGPAGAVVLAAGALTYFTLRAREADESASTLDGRIRGLNTSFADLSSRQAEAAMLDYNEALESAVAIMQSAQSRAASLQTTIDQLHGTTIPDDLQESLIRAQAAADDAGDRVDYLVGKLGELYRIASGEAPIAEDVESASEAFEKLNRQLEERLLLIGMDTDAQRLSARIAAGYVEDLKEGEAEILVALQRRIDAREEIVRAEREAARAAESANQARAAEEQARLDGIASEISALERAAAQWGKSADAILINNLRTQDATEAQLAHAASLQETIRGYEAAESAQANYQSLIQELRTDEERLTDQLRERLAVLDSVSNATAQDYSRVAAAAFQDAPQSSGLSPEIGGPFSELSRINQEQAALEDWYQTQLDLLEQFREERSDLTEHWDERERQLAQEHQDKIQQIESARHQAQLAAAENLFGNIAGITSAFAGEQSSIYRAMFLAQKAAAIAQAVVAIQQGIALAAANPWPQNLSAMASVAAATAGIVGSIQSVTIDGMAHDGIDSIPKTGTWLLERGERVTTAETSAKLDRKLDEISSGQAGGEVHVNIINNAPVNIRRGEVYYDGDRRQMDIIIEAVTQAMDDGSLDDAGARNWGVNRASGAR